MLGSKVDDLRQEIADGQVIAIVGAGVSIGATNNNPVASWVGLLRHGVDPLRGVRAEPGQEMGGPDPL
jgi:hypothetical protein